MALAMALTVGLGFADKVSAAPISTGFHAYPKLGKDGHVYASWYNLHHYSNSGISIEAASVYKMYDLEKGVISAVNVYDDTDIIRFSEKMHEYKNQGFVNVLFRKKQ